MASILQSIGNTAMKLWTIQNIASYERLLQTGTLISNHHERLFCEHSFRHAYDWMSKKMIESNIYPPGHDIKYPVWAWYQWEGKRKRLDMRKCGYAKRGDKIVQLTIDVDMGKVLLSDFDLFHYVLNYWYLPLDEKDGKKFETELTGAGFSWSQLSDTQIENEALLLLREKMIKSWDRIFDLSREDDGWLYSKLCNNSIQATLWQIKIDQVKKAEMFIAK
jgi:hypothetical protein